MTTTKQKILDYLTSLLAEGYALQSTFRRHNQLDAASGARFFVKVQHLVTLLGDFAGPWRRLLEKGLGYEYDTMDVAVGTLEGIKELVDGDLLFRVERLAEAEVFSDLLMQADHLHSQNYHVAAGILGRCVLEGHLRKWCDAKNCLPTKPRPTIGDYNMALYNAKHTDSTAMHNVNAMAAIGNDAAHKQIAPEEKVEQLLSDVRRFLDQHRIT